MSEQSTSKNGISSSQGGNPVTRIVADTAACVRFFSRLSVPRLGGFDDPTALPDFTTMARAAPLAGLVVALPAALLLFLLGLSALPPLATGIMTCAALAMVTGALHEDGLSDIADGFFGGAARERRLDIMKDSRIGAFGALALVIAIGLRAVLLAGLLERYGPAAAAAALMTCEIFSRSLLVWQWHRLPPARPEGLGARFGTPNAGATVQAAVTGFACVALASAMLPAVPLATGTLCAGLAAWALAGLARAKIGGQTGDVLGGIQQISGLGFLFGILLLP
ncbi:cobalamin-5'-phosphate synthase [Roseibium hamelinense]|uniref:Adenosylcobinamide-GDP ribazoletransferase n=1 Tax=Roseibium hamelinense TaxID=150831 RepID=A0A562T7F0_9HYPH|nr:adenosylcobinamide-GDP ribazoletransferase [Roseibium hamelinense]MTI42060.1 adenosylcobinamide-GDP ribazoletransferase [Roseibium hamelinense]TWI89517.1 cobalamin-5'-phosphate synthase [Roseibium hamelinense]